MTPQRFLALCAAALLGMCGLAALNSWVQFGMPTKNGYYTCSYVDEKIRRGHEMASPKLVIIAGSNALAGIDAERLGHMLGIHVFNFGLSASFGPGFQTFEGAKVLKPGDAALLPLEYLAYDYSTPQDSLVDAVYSCGADYWASLDWRQRLFFVLAAKPWRSFDALLFRYNVPLMEKTRALAQSDVGPYGQGHRIVVPKVDVASHEPLDIHFVSSSPGVTAIVRFIKWAHAHHVRVFATWPNTLYFGQYAQQPVFARIAAFWRSQGVTMLGTPQQAMFPPEDMADTIYHTNNVGEELRTTRLVALFRANPAFQAWRRQ